MDRLNLLTNTVHTIKLILHLFYLETVIVLINVSYLKLVDLSFYKTNINGQIQNPKFTTTQHGV